MQTQHQKHNTKEGLRKMRALRLYLCDFGYGIRRYDIGKVSILENIADDGTYRGQGWAVQFDFSTATLEFLHRLYRFMKEKEEVK